MKINFRLKDGDTFQIGKVQLANGSYVYDVKFGVIGETQMLQTKRFSSKGDARDELDYLYNNGFSSEILAARGYVAIEQHEADEAMVDYLICKRLYASGDYAVVSGMLLIKKDGTTKFNAVAENISGVLDVLLP